MNSIDRNIVIDIDQQIVGRIRRGEYNAIKEVYKLYYPAVERMILNNNGCEDEAKDIFQEAVIVLYDRIMLKDFKLNSKLQTFLFAICKRMWLKQLTRGNAQYNTSDIAILEDSLADDYDDGQQEKLEKNIKQMDSAMEKLGEPCKSLLMDFYVANKTMQEISEKFGYTNANNAKTQKYKCLQRLKKFFFTT